MGRPKSDKATLTNAKRKRGGEKRIVIKSVR